MSQLPKEIEQFIKDEAEKEYPLRGNEDDYSYPGTAINRYEREAYKAGATFMHTHLTESHEKEIAELKAEIKELKNIMQNHRIIPKEEIKKAQIIAGENCVIESLKAKGIFKKVGHFNNFEGSDGSYLPLVMIEALNKLVEKINEQDQRIKILESKP